LSGGFDGGADLVVERVGAPQCAGPLRSHRSTTSTRASSSSIAPSATGRARCAGSTNVNGLPLDDAPFEPGSQGRGTYKQEVPGSSRDAHSRHVLLSRGF
jgi:hypothetical protein